MNEPLLLSRNDQNQFTVVIADHSYASIHDLRQAIPAIDAADNLMELCEAINHFARGYQYRVIRNPEEFKTLYHERLAATDHGQPWTESSVGAGDFGTCELSSITLPHKANNEIVFFVEDTYLGIPYRVAIVSPVEALDTIRYEPLPMVPSVVPGESN